MIRFLCPGCGRQFNVPDDYAGKQAHCKNCKHQLVVPAASDPRAAAPLAPVAVAAKMPVRTRRLIADLQQMRQAFGEDSAIRIVEVQGQPAEVYKIEYTIRGVESLQSKRPVFREKHLVEIRMTSDYPRLAPACRMLTPIFHPNIDDSAICVGDHWTAGERLTDLAIRIGEMIAYQAYNVKSPLNGEAAMWADLNPDALPVDNRNLNAASPSRVH
jgi:ubiquitin-protein ligase/DNA-directed RNA polymerase subunit RPC12/RpoP